jgi:hypothetical protein
MNDLALATLLLDVAPNPLEVHVELGKEEKDKDGHYVLPLLVKVPVSKLMLLPQERQHVGRYSVYLCARDTKGRVSAVSKAEVPLVIPNDELLNALSRTAGYATRLKVRSGEQKLAVAVRDDIATVDSSLNLVLDVGERR